jgi:hypothetical protein
MPSGGGSMLATPDPMSAGGSLFLIAIGAMLHWAVTYRVPGVNVPMLGLILMVAGVIGLFFSLVAAATHRHRLE